MENYLSLTTVFNYLEATPNSRCFVEGEQVLNSKHLILVGIIDGKLNSVGTYSAIKIMALCLQTSALLTGRPHQISGWLELDPSTAIWKIKPFTCSCKAGACGRCKHVSATLLKCSRVDLQKLEKLSGTDVECYWKSQKKQIQEDYRACPIRNIKCFKYQMNSNLQLSEAQQRRCAEFLMTNNPNSALSKHKQGRRTLTVDSNKDCNVSTPNWLQPLLNAIGKSTFLPGLDLSPDKFDLRDCCKVTYARLCEVDITKIIISCYSGSEDWKIHRKYRLTGSRCYVIYTYNGEDWISKSTKYFNPKGFVNKFVQHGLLYEKEARECYIAKLGYSVIETGFIICSRYPWLGVSPDGIIFHDGRPLKLLEIKCPFAGRTKDAAEFVSECDYLHITVSGVQLKHNHSYYAQIQIGMSILNLESCDFIIYSSFSKTFLRVEVPFDANFAKDLIERITLNYFNHMLHVICESK